MKRYASLGLIAGAALGALLCPAHAGACEQTEYGYVVTGEWPEAGARNVPVNSPFLLRLKGDPVDGSLYSADAQPWLELRAEGSDQFIAVDGQFIEPYPLGLEPTNQVSFVPDEPLAPGTRYEVRAGLLVQGLAQQLEQSASWQITTGAAALAQALRLEGGWSVDFEAGTDPVFECRSKCSPASCDEVGAIPATKARLTIPGVVGGFSDGLAEGLLSVYWEGTDGTRHPTHSVIVEDARVTTELLVTLPLVGGEAYEPCFSYEVKDARRDVVSDEFCAESAFPVPPKAGAGAGADADQDLRTTTSSCSIGRAPGGAASLPWALLSGFAYWGWLSRRRRPKNAL